MNAPVHTPADAVTPVNFERRLGEELTARAAARPVGTPVGTPVGMPVRVRSRRTRRIAVTSLGLAAAVTAVVVGTHAGGGHDAPEAVPGVSTPVAGPVTPAVRDAGYTVTVRPDHVVALKIVGTQLSGLQATLRRAGLPAVVMTPAASCVHKVTPVDTGRLTAVMSLDPKDGRVALLDPAAVPHGDSVLVVNESPAGARHASVGSLAVLLTRPAPSCFPASQVDVGEG